MQRAAIMAEPGEVIQLGAGEFEPFWTPTPVIITNSLESVRLVSPSAGSFVTYAAYQPPSSWVGATSGTSSPTPVNPVTTPLT